MAKLIYSMPTSLDGHTEDAHGHFGWALPKTRRCIPTSTSSLHRWESVKSDKSLDGRKK
jgi:hypothetical protein